jgi:hypothetical protein
MLAWLKNNNNNNTRLGAVSHSCNPSYSGGGDQEDCSSSSGKKVSEALSQTIKSWVWLCSPTIPDTEWGVNRRIMVQTGLGINARFYLKNNQSQKSSSGRAPA